MRKSTDAGAEETKLERREKRKQASSDQGRRRCCRLVGRGRSWWWCETAGEVDVVGGWMCANCRLAAHIRNDGSTHTVLLPLNIPTHIASTYLYLHPHTPSALLQGSWALLPGCSLLDVALQARAQRRGLRSVRFSVWPFFGLLTANSLPRHRICRNRPILNLQANRLSSPPFPFPRPLPLPSPSASPPAH